MWEKYRVEFFEDPVLKNTDSDNYEQQSVYLRGAGLSGESWNQSTDAAFLVKAFGYHHISVGDCHKASDVPVDSVHHIRPVHEFERLPVGHAEGLGCLQVHIVQHIFLHQYDIPLDFYKYELDIFCPQYEEQNL